MKTFLSLVATLGALFFSTGATRAAESGKPNIIFILADDQGIDGLGCYGAERFKGKTPNIDALAQTGTRFTQCYANPLCGPSRCTLMTGRYVFRTGGTTNNNAGTPSPEKEVGIAKVLKEAGYATAQAGKWRQMGATPADWGFDEYLSDPSASGWYNQGTYLKNRETVKAPDGAYQPDIMHAFALDFIRRKKDGPFFLYYASHLVHRPILKTPDSKAGGNVYEEDAAYLDKQVGELVAELDKLGLREKTLIVYAGDNGTKGEAAPINGRKVLGEKGSLLEGGSRVPLIANWKGTTPAGKVLDDLVDFSDMFPTFAALGGAKLPAGVTIDGHSYSPQLRGEKGTPREWVFVQLAQGWYVREQGWKLTQTGDLFDMSDAPFAEKPVAADAANEAATAARTRLHAVLAKLNPAGTADGSPAERPRRARNLERRAAAAAAAAAAAKAATPAPAPPAK
ncbi:MAG TPA: sulfatase-like hydrolase/transferase [Chthoniobacteraceae bacterium]|jgi:arylsulfatase A-like enzyme|nr:sulfatase-like hydrolase/transferase [Chthoniobacteraceae bacterium]